MSGDALQGPEFASGDQPLLDLAVGRRKEHVVADRHHIGPGLDATERGRKVTFGVSAYVAALPLPGHREQVVRIDRREIAGHEVIDEGLHRVEAERLVSPSSEEVGAPPHHRPQFGLALEAGGDIGRRTVLAAVEPRIGCNRFGECIGEDEIVLGVLGGAGDRERRV